MMLLLLAAFVWTCLAIPAPDGNEAKPSFSTNVCEGTGNAMQEVYMTMGYYADESCTALLKTARYHSAQGTCPTYRRGDFICFPNIMNAGPNIYAKVLQSSGPGAQLDVVEDQQCTLDEQPAAVVATFNANRDSCVRLFGLTGGEGVIIWPEGGSGISLLNERLATNQTFAFNDSSTRSDQAITVQDRDVRCRGFDVSSSEVVSTRSMQISDTVNCRNSATACQISHSSQHQTSIKSSFNLSAGIALGFFDVQAEFGFEYANTLTTSIQETVAVPVNQQGYLTTYSKATRFHGTFTGCDGRAGADTTGEILALHDNGLTYQVVLTNG